MSNLLIPLKSRLHAAARDISCDSNYRHIHKLLNETAVTLGTIEQIFEEEKHKESDLRGLVLKRFVRILRERQIFFMTFNSVSRDKRGFINDLMVQTDIEEEKAHDVFQEIISNTHELEAKAEFRLQQGDMDVLLDTMENQRNVMTWMAKNMPPACVQTMVYRAMNYPCKLQDPVNIEELSACLHALSSFPWMKEAVIISRLSGKSPVYEKLLRDVYLNNKLGEIQKNINLYRQSPEGSPIKKEMQDKLDRYFEGDSKIVVNIKPARRIDKIRHGIKTKVLKKLADIIKC